MGSVSVMSQRGLQSLSQVEAQYFLKSFEALIAVVSLVGFSFKHRSVALKCLFVLQMMRETCGLPHPSGVVAFIFASCLLFAKLR